jgi:hypothetical protein
MGSKLAGMGTTCVSTVNPHNLQPPPPQFECESLPNCTPRLSRSSCNGSSFRSAP